MANWQPPQGNWPPPPAPGQPPWGPAPPANGKATTALVLGICGIALCPLILSIPALVLGYQARGEIDRSGGTQGGRGQAIAGIVMGWIGLVLGLLILAFFVFVLAIDPDFLDSNDFEVGPNDTIN